MTSPHRFLANDRNAAAAATVTATSVRPAERTIHPRRLTRTGNGTITLTGPYTGAADTVVEVEIRPSGGSAVGVTDPVFAGAGNGALAEVSADPGSVDQVITVTLADLGTATTQAQLAVYGHWLIRAKAGGAGGNALVLTVAPSLTLSDAPVGALSIPIAADTAEWSDRRGDFGAAALNPDGTIPATAPRLVFGRNPAQVYRHFKRWDGARWQYGISPAAATGYAVGDLVHTVAGSYAVTITDGATTETYPGVVTLYDLLLALNGSALVEAVGVVANDQKPGGIAALDLPLRTQSYLLPISKSAPDLPDLQNVAIADDAPTETVTLKCTKNTPLGAETWAVLSRVAGELPPATTGVPYEGEFLAFTVPVVVPAVVPTQGSIAITKQELSGSEADPPVLPGICLDRPRLGIKASTKTLKLVYKRRPLADCVCTNAAVTGGPDPDCLGQDAAEGGSMGTLAAGYQSRLEELYTWRRGFINANTAIDADHGTLTTVFNDVELADQVTRIFADCLAELFADSATPDPDALAQWDGELTAMDAELIQFIGMAGEPAESATVLRFRVGLTYRPSDTVLPPVALRNGHQYRFHLFMLELGDPPAWTAMEAFVPSADVTQWPVNGDSVEVPGQVYETYGGAPTAEGTALLVDMGAVADVDNVVAADPAVWRRAVDQFVRRYAAQMDLVLVKAGIVPKSDASGAGSPCWRDPGDAYWWEFEDEPYLPVFNNVYYHSARMACDDDANAVTSGQQQPRPTPTYEFGFGLRVGCPERLQVGDAITISILGVSTGYPYDLGDTYQIPIVGGGPLAFAGGADGTDTLTWTVQSDAQGVLDDYALGLAEAPYSDGGVGFILHRGAIPFALGDAFTFAVETGGQFRWRRDGGAWSADTAIAPSVALADGLTAAFARGVNPSFVPGDGYGWDVLQPYSPLHVRAPTRAAWRWEGDGATLTAPWPADTPIAALALWHDCPVGTTFTAVGKAAGGATLWTKALAYRAGLIVVPLEATDAVVDCRTLELTIANAADGSLRWLWAGVPWTPRHRLDTITLRESWSMLRSAAPAPDAQSIGRSASGEIGWSIAGESWMEGEDWGDALALIDRAKTGGDEPLIFVPNAEYPAEARLVRIGADEIEVADNDQYQTDRRLLTVNIPLTGVPL
ncbi:MAG: hypothetical protein P9F19_01485 [Candidatus Contendobacter sp.]|nr:hypothetical protein [Candidatus Contendobacter sp.]MDG4556062.1 hypothetical protein [Candidatus Contendobacter sp.]